MPLDMVAVSAFGTLLSGFGSLIGKVNDQSLKVEFMEKQIVLLSKFQDLQLAYAEVTEDNRNLKREIEALTEKLHQKGKVKPSDGNYWLILEDGKLAYTPLCPLCYVTDDKVNFLSHHLGKFWWCHVHSKDFEIRNHLGTERS